MAEAASTLLQHSYTMLAGSLVGGYCVDYKVAVH